MFKGKNKLYITFSEVRRSLCPTKKIAHASMVDRWNPCIKV